MSHKHTYGQPKSILMSSEENEVMIDTKTLDQIFNDPEIQDRKVVILSLIGAFRGGKSFFLDYCLRFLYANFPSVKNSKKIKKSSFKIDENWMGKSDEPLKGFSWRSGTQRDTIGIIMWSDVFLHTINGTGEKVAIFVMDTQGLFDNDSTPLDNSRIFSLGTLISSIQVLNISNRIQEDQLQYLQFATEFTKMTAINTDELSEKPFQNLFFIIRDWNNAHEYKYGVAGGQSYIENILIPRPNQKPELKSVRESIHNCFDQIQCCLLPYPGNNVASNQDFNGCWSKMDIDFKDELKAVIEHILCPKNLVLKKINSKDIKVPEMKELFQAYLKSFQSNETIKVSSIYELTVENQMNNLVKQCVDTYKLTFARIKDSYSNIMIVHEISKSAAVEIFNCAKKMGNPDHIEKFYEMLEEKIEEIFVYLKKEGQSFLKRFDVMLMNGLQTLAVQAVMGSVIAVNATHSTFDSIYSWMKKTFRRNADDKPDKNEATFDVDPIKLNVTTDNINSRNTTLIIGLIIAIICGVFTAGIGALFNWFGGGWVSFIIVFTILTVSLKLWSENINIPDAISAGNEAVTEASESFTNAAQSISKAANAGTSVASAVRKFINVFKK